MSLQMLAAGRAVGFYYVSLDDSGCLTQAGRVLRPSAHRRMGWRVPHSPGLYRIHVPSRPN